MPPQTPTEQLSDLLSLVADQTRLAEQVARLVEASQEWASQQAILRSTLNSMVEDRHLHLLPALEALRVGVDRLRDEVKEALERNAGECQDRRDRLDVVINEIRTRGARQDYALTQANKKAPDEGLELTWRQKVKPTTVAKWIAWAVVTLGSFFGGGQLLGNHQTKPPALSAPKGTP